MLTITTRPYSDSEKKLLLQQLPSVYSRVENFTMAFIFILAFFLIPFLIAAKYLPVLAEFQIIALCSILLISGVITYHFTVKYQGKFSNKQKLVAINQGEAEVLHIKTSRAMKREDPEDFGPAFYIDVVDGPIRRTLYLCSQEMEHLEDEKLFPNSEFLLIRKLDSKEVIDITTMGVYFEPENTLPAFDKTTWRSKACPMNGELLAQALDDIIS